MTIPLLDLRRQIEPLRCKIDSAIAKVIDSARFILGPEVAEFESEVAAYSGVAQGIGCASGSDALIIALKAVGVQPGDEVITTAYSFYATAGAICHVGARPVFVDIDSDTFNMDTGQLAARITKRTRAILPVHLFGQMVDMESITSIAGSIPVIEDSAQSLGARWNGVSTGNWSHAACISFFPSKNLGGFGDGGMILTNRPEIAEKCRSLRVHGARKTYLHEEVGYNSRLDTLQAAVLQVMLPSLENWTASRARNADYYSRALGQLCVRIPGIREKATSVFNQYVIRVAERDRLRSRLTSENIGNAVYYPIPLPFQPCFKDLGYRPGDFPNSESAAATSIAIPVFPGLTQPEMDCVIRVIREHCEGL